MCSILLIFFQLTDDMCSLVWTVSNPMCEKLLKMTDEEFVDSLNTALVSFLLFIKNTLVKYIGTPITLL